MTATDPPPRPDPPLEPVDWHIGPLDRDDDGRWLARDDPRRRGRLFDQDDPDAA